MGMRGYAKPVECECTHNFTCGVCLRNAPPWVWTPTKAHFGPPINLFTGEPLQGDPPS